MKKMLYQMYSGVMDADWNPLRKIPDLALRHLIMQVLAWMWCIIFSLYFGSFVVFGITAAAHFLLIFGTFITAATFATAPKIVRSKFKNTD
ncbi:MAG: hypothetical protein ACJ0RM_04560 [Alphaproteobacteria bacterium]|jgi:hypothetical protein